MKRIRLRFLAVISIVFLLNISLVFATEIPEYSKEEILELAKTLTSSYKLIQEVAKDETGKEITITYYSNGESQMSTDTYNSLCNIKNSTDTQLKKTTSIINNNTYNYSNDPTSTIGLGPEPSMQRGLVYLTEQIISTTTKTNVAAYKEVDGYIIQAYESFESENISAASYTGRGPTVISDWDDKIADEASGGDPEKKEEILDGLKGRVEQEEDAYSDSYEDATETYAPSNNPSLFAPKPDRYNPSPLVPNANNFIIAGANNKNENLKTGVVVGNIDTSIGGGLVSILQLLYQIGLLVAVCVFAFMGVQFIIASPQQKAQLKASLYPYFIGLLLYVAGVPIATIIINIFMQIL